MGPPDPHLTNLLVRYRRLTLLIAILLTPDSNAHAQDATIFANAQPARWIAPAQVPGDSFTVFHARRTFELTAVPARSSSTSARTTGIDCTSTACRSRPDRSAPTSSTGVTRPSTSRRTFARDATSSPRWPGTGAPHGRWRSTATAPDFSCRGIAGAINQAPLAVFDGSGGGAIVGRAKRRAMPPGEYGEISGWQLEPRSIPPMEERIQRLARVRRATGVTLHEGFLRGTGDLVIPPHTRASLLLDQSHATNERRPRTPCPPCVLQKREDGLKSGRMPHASTACGSSTPAPHFARIVHNPVQ